METIKNNETSNTQIVKSAKIFISIAQLVQSKLLNNITNRPLRQEGKKSLLISFGHSV